MKPNQKNRFNGRMGNSSTRTSKGQIVFRNTALDSSGPAGKLRGTALQLSDKYLAVAKDALLQNDRVLAESCLQFADHYVRVQNLAIQNEQTFRPQNKPFSKPESEEDGEKPETLTAQPVPPSLNNEKPDLTSEELSSSESDSGDSSCHSEPPLSSPKNKLSLRKRTKSPQASTSAEKTQETESSV